MSWVESGLELLFRLYFLFFYFLLLIIIRRKYWLIHWIHWICILLLGIAINFFSDRIETNKWEEWLQHCWQTMSHTLNRSQQFINLSYFQYKYWMNLTIKIHLLGNGFPLANNVSPNNTTAQAIKWWQDFMDSVLVCSVGRVMRSEASVASVCVDRSVWSAFGRLSCSVALLPSLPPNTHLNSF